jgi:hypothetical protein
MHAQPINRDKTGKPDRKRAKIADSSHSLQNYVKRGGSFGVLGKMGISRETALPLPNWSKMRYNRRLFSHSGAGVRGTCRKTR